MGRHLKINRTLRHSRGMTKLSKFIIFFPSISHTLHVPAAVITPVAFQKSCSLILGYWGFFPLEDPSYEIMRKISNFIESVFFVLVFVMQSLEMWAELQRINCLIALLSVRASALRAKLRFLEEYDTIHILHLEGHRMSEFLDTFVHLVSVNSWGSIPLPPPKGH